MSKKQRKPPSPMDQVRELLANPSIKADMVDALLAGGPDRTLVDQEGRSAAAVATVEEVAARCS